MPVTNNRSQEVLRSFRELSKRAVIEAAEIIQKAAEPSTPIDTQRMINTSDIKRAEINNGKAESGFGYTVDYAPIVHEATDENTNWTRPGSRPKWLERSANESLEAQKARMRKVMSELR